MKMSNDLDAANASNHAVANAIEQLEKESVRMKNDLVGARKKPRLTATQTDSIEQHKQCPSKAELAKLRKCKRDHSEGECEVVRAKRQRTKDTKDKTVEALNNTIASLNRTISQLQAQAPQHTNKGADLTRQQPYPPHN